MSASNIVFTRIDNRLVHGQVGNIWVTNCNANLIVVVDDDVCHDELQQSLMKMTADAVGVGIRFFSLQKTIDVIAKASPSQRIFLVAKTPEVIETLVEHHVPIHSCNIGNMHPAEGKKVFHDAHVYADDNDIASLLHLKEMGVEVYIQITPTDRKHNI